MFNKRHEQNPTASSNQTVNVQVSGSASGPANLIVTLAIVALLAAVVGAVWQVAIAAIAAITAIALALFAALIGAIPWLVAGGVALGLGRVVVQSLPDAIEGIETIRYRRAIARQAAKMIEQKTIDGFVQYQEANREVNIAK